MCDDFGEKGWVCLVGCVMCGVVWLVVGGGGGGGGGGVKLSF